MSRTRQAATALSLIALLASCGSDDRPEANRPEATESGRTEDQATSTPTAAPTGTSTRPLTYADDYSGKPPFWRMRTIQYGDRALRPGLDVTAIDVTDDGLALVAADGGIYFTDGSSTERIGKHTIEHGLAYFEGGVKTSTSGSLVAWFSPSWRSLVVYDTQERRVVTKVPTPGCAECNVEAVVGEHVYYSPEVYPRELMLVDVPTGRVSETDGTALSKDLRSHPRGFVKGDSYATGEVVNQDVNDEAVFFVPRGSSLELSRIVRETGADIDGDGEGDGPVVYGYGGFDTTGRRLNLRLPGGYTPAENPYVLFQWLDDDRFAVMAGATDNFGIDGESGYGDILVCDIARERCTLAAHGPPGGAGPHNFRLVPHLTLPN